MICTVGIQTDQLLVPPDLRKRNPHPAAAHGVVPASPQEGDLRRRALLTHPPAFRSLRPQP